MTLEMVQHETTEGKDPAGKTSATDRTPATGLPNDAGRSSGTTGDRADGEDAE